VINDLRRRQSKKDLRKRSRRQVKQFEDEPKQKNSRVDSNQPCHRLGERGQAQRHRFAGSPH
jgi:hypothetical protein